MRCMRERLQIDGKFEKPSEKKARGAKGVLDPATIWVDQLAKRLTRGELERQVELML